MSSSSFNLFGSILYIVSGAAAHDMARARVPRPEFLPSLNTSDSAGYLRDVVGDTFFDEGARKRLEAHTVTKIIHYKGSIFNLPHECLIVVVRDSTGNELSMLVEREELLSEFLFSSPWENASDTTRTVAGPATVSPATGAPVAESQAADDSLKAPAPSQPPTAIPSSSTSSVEIRPIPTVDSITFIPFMHHPTWFRLEVVTPSTPLQLLHFIAIVATVHRRKPPYNSLDAQCYWYATTVINAVKALGVTCEQSRGVLRSALKTWDIPPHTQTANLDLHIIPPPSSLDKQERAYVKKYNKPSTSAPVVKVTLEQILQILVKAEALFNKKKTEINQRWAPYDPKTDEGVRQAWQRVDEARREARQRVDEARREARQRVDEARREAWQRVDEARREADEAKRQADEAKRQADEAEHRLNQLRAEIQSRTSKVDKKN